MLLSLGTRSGRFSTTPMGFHPGSLVLSASIIREDKEPAFCPRAAIEEQRASPIAKQKTLTCFIAPRMHVGISKRLYIAAQLLVSRQTGQVPSYDFTFPTTALHVQIDDSMLN